MDFFICLVVGALAPFFIWVTFQEGMIFEAWGRFLDTKQGKWAKPLGKCPTCMSPWIAWVLPVCMGLEWYLVVAVVLSAPALVDKYLSE
jgi:hypothetical protein